MGRAKVVLRYVQRYVTGCTKVRENILREKLGRANPLIQMFNRFSFALKKDKTNKKVRNHSFKLLMHGVLPFFSRDFESLSVYCIFYSPLAT